MTPKYFVGFLIFGIIVNVSFFNCSDGSPSLVYDESSGKYSWKPSPQISPRSKSSSHSSSKVSPNPQYSSRQSSPVVVPAVSPVSRIHDIVSILYHRARERFDVSAHNAIELIKEVAEGKDPMHKDCSMVRSILHEFNLILEDGSFDKELMRLYKNLK